MFRSWIPLFLSLYLLSALPSLAEDAELSPSDYLGCWIGRVVVDREASEVRIGVSAGNQGVLASLWIPAMGAGPIPMGAVTAERERVLFGPIALDVYGEDLRGVLPDSMDPGDRLEVRFRRSRWLQSDCKTALGMELEAVWEASVPGGVWAAALVDQENHQVVAGTLGGHLVALDVESGEAIWSTQLTGSVRSAPVILGGNIYAASDDGLVRAIDRKDGRVIRKFRVANALSPAYQPAPGKDFHYRGHQLLVRDVGLVVGTLDGKMHLIDAEGRISALGKNLDTPIAALAGTENGFFVSTRGGTVYRMDPEARTVWKSELAGPIHGDLVIEGSNLYAGDRGYYLWSLDPDSGAARWKKKFFFSWIESAPVLSDGVLFVGSSDAKSTRAIDPTSGALFWSAATKGWPWANPLIFEDLVVQGEAGRRGYLTELRPGMVFFDTVTGRKIHELEADLADHGVSGYVVPPVISGDLMIAFDAIGGVKAWRLRRENQSAND